MKLHNIQIIAIAALLAAPLMASCGKNGEDAKKAEEERAQIEAAMLEGRDAARIFVSREWKDTVDLQRNLLEARARRTKFDTIGHPKAAAAFDSTFVSTIRTVRPDVARHLK